MIDMALLGLAANAAGTELPAGAIVRFRAEDSTGFHQGKITSLPAFIGDITLTQTDAAKQPLQKTDTTNNREYLQFTRADKTSLNLAALNIDTWAGATGKTMTVLLVLKPRAVSDGRQFSWVKGSAAGWDTSSLMNIYCPYSNSVVYYDVGSSSTGRTHTTAAVPNPTGHVTSYLLERDNRIGKIYQNGVSQAVTLTSLTDATLISGSTGGLRLGGSPEKETNYSDFDFYELAVYPRALTDAEKIEVNNYVKKTYGV